MKNDCIFCKILKGNIPGEKIYEDDFCLVVMDKYLVMKGQCLLISKKHEEYLFDLDKTNYTGCFLASQKIIKSIDKALKTDRTCLVVEGFEVAHAHIKIFPTFDGNLKIHGGKEASSSELFELAEKIRKSLGN